MKSSKIVACYGQLCLNAVSAWTGKDSDRTMWHRTGKTHQSYRRQLAEGCRP